MGWKGEMTHNERMHLAYIKKQLKKEVKKTENNEAYVEKEEGKKLEVKKKEVIKK